MQQRVGPVHFRQAVKRRERAADLVASRYNDSFSAPLLGLCWASFLALHVVCLVYFAATAWCYWNLPGTSLDRWLSLYYIGLGTQSDRTIAIVHGCMAAVHGVYILWMLLWSVKKRRLVFAVYNVVKSPTRLSSIGSEWQAVESVKNCMRCLYRAVLTRDGCLGVDGPNFDVILLCREIIETALQTYQAYRMSLLLPRAELNRGYVALLVLNCWSTALVHSVFHSNATTRRLVALICDCVLDLVSSVGISTTLVLIYAQDFNFQTNGFPFLKWYEDEWLVNAMSEFQMLLVTSWTDLVTRVVFALSLLGNMNNMKKLIRAKPSKWNSDFNARHRVTAVAPFRASLIDSKLFASWHDTRPNAVKYAVAKLTELLFLSWGLAVLALHLHAGSVRNLPQCMMQVKPWGSSQPSCSLLVLDCHQTEIAGSTEEVTEQWSAFDPTTVVRVVVRHCPELQLPPRLTEFSQLDALKMYNTTIVSWEDSAALTQSHHPKIKTLFLVRVNMTDGALPIGLQADDFPQALQDIEFCVTNLRSLPDDLELKWPQYASIYLEASQLVEVPASLVRLAPYDLSLSLNPISTLPAELFERDSVGYLSFGGTFISQLPEAVTEVSTSLFDVNLSGTNVSFFWAWLDPIAEQDSGYPPLTAANTPYCRDLQRIFEGEQTSFSVISPTSEDGMELSLLSNASVENWMNLKRAVSCDEESATWYPIEFEDQYSRIS
ncbi:hypothetical protein BBJ28_00008574 [Nothophytophthora sp. Chile5]|nr:hypothetical protein BBJ28_00008574 [Nothophytophthora sp. Chile5]